MMDEAGLSIFLTSLTSSLAFALGCVTQAPAVRWMCFYGFPGILLDFVFQITFFIACIVLDERRIQNSRMDCLVCVPRKGAAEIPEGRRGPCLDGTEKFMVSFARCLFHPLSKVFVVMLFTGMFVACVISATSLEHIFDFTELLPDDSYVLMFYDAYDGFTEDGAVFAGVFFRDVDQTDSAIQDQMIDYYERLTEQEDIEAIGCWVIAYRDYLVDNPEASNLTIPEVVKMNPSLDKSQLDDAVTFVFDESGRIVLSSCAIRVFLPYGSTDRQIGVVEHIHDVTRTQPINNGSMDGPFFVYDQIFQLWEYSLVAIDELTIMTITSVTAVGSISLLLMPHWSSALFMFPMLAVMYLDVLGFMQWFDVPINASTTTILTISVGLLVDYMMHILFSYLALKGTRVERARLALETIGTSVFLGGSSTLIGVLFLGFGQTQVFQTLFTLFVIIILVGMAHGLIFLPVVLSIVGPELVGHKQLEDGKPVSGTSLDSEKSSQE